MKTLSIILAGFLLMQFVGGCSRKSNALSQSSLALQVALKSQENAMMMLDRVSEQAHLASSAGQINHDTNRDIQNYVAAERAKIQAVRMDLESAQQDVRDFNEERGNKKEAEILANASRAIFASAELIRILEKKTEVIVDFLGSETFSKSEIGALFKPGEYRLIKEQVREGQRLFGPVVDKLYLFADKYKDSFSGLRGQIIVTGYSDATAVEAGSGLFRDLASKLPGEAPTQQDLNVKLSELRADAVKQLLLRIIADRRRSNDRLIDISVQTLGRGEELPPGLSEDISKNDHRRRVVTFYWVVLPSF